MHISSQVSFDSNTCADPSVLVSMLSGRWNKEGLHAEQSKQRAAVQKLEMDIEEEVMLNLKARFAASTKNEGRS